MGNGVVFMGISFELIALCVGGYFLGNFIDDQMHWKNVVSTYLVLVLLVGWFVHLVYLLRKYERDNADSKSDPNSDPKP